MYAPPLLAGAMKATVACPSPAVAVPMDGVPGTVTAITELEGAESGPVPTLFTAATVKVYDVPPVSPVKMYDDSDVVVCVILPGLAVMV